LESLNDANILDFRGFIDPDDLFMLFYHGEYLIALVAGIFDNLALLAQVKFQIKVDKIGVSLSKDSGDEFLDILKTHDPKLTSIISNFRDFINLIYEFRNEVVHGVGMNKVNSPLAPNWSSFVEITPQVNYYIESLGDDKSEYKIISKWGVIKQNSSLLLDPYYFSKCILQTLTKFSDDYLKQLN
jgi:hypothetical protein